MTTLLNILYETFKKSLEERNLKQTPERFAILRAISHLEIPFHIDDLKEHLIQSKYHVSRSTIYNTLKLLEEIGIIEKHLIHNKVYYSLLSPDQNQFTLISQNGVNPIEIEEELIELLISYINKKYSASVKQIKISFIE